MEDIDILTSVAKFLIKTNKDCKRVFGKDVEEYFSEGFFALQIAKKNYNPLVGVAFSTYAVKVIKNRLMRIAKCHKENQSIIDDCVGEVDSEPYWEMEEELDQLDSRTRTVLEMRYGLNGNNPMTLDGVGEKLGLSGERIRQIEKEGLNKLRAVYETE